LFDAKINLGVKGRESSLEILRTHIDASDKVIWFHCASLGEYEQGLPVFQEIKNHFTDHKIVMTFFSPSGFEIRQSNPVSDVVVYLPLDTRRNARRFLDLIHPELVLFVKYELWPNYLNELYRRKIRSILISASFRREQSYFKFYGSWMRRSLRAFEHIFVQTPISKELLESIGYHNVTISGDTRFDRVNNQLLLDNSVNFIKEFKGDNLCVIAGSTWPEDEGLLAEYINTCKKKIKFIIAPHAIKPNRLKNLRATLNRPNLLYSEVDQQKLSEYQVLIIDSIGLLSRLYSYADVVYIGGAYGTTGLHNTLEAAVFGVPVIIGRNYNKFPEAQDMIEAGGMYAISTQNEFNSILNSLLSNPDIRKQSGAINRDYVQKNKGTVIQIINYIRK
jgi:3-deoxy-D-manno-octulosonic-acid transferase